MENRSVGQSELATAVTSTECTLAYHQKIVAAMVLVALAARQRHTNYACDLGHDSPANACHSQQAIRDALADAVMDSAAGRPCAKEETAG